MADATAQAAKPNTRSRILQACRELFNECGPGNVTTAQIAATVGINEGNLYYHFKRKEQMLEALFDHYESCLREAARADFALGGDPARYTDYLQGWFTLMWEWRFFYRDSGLIARTAPSLRPKVKSLSDYGQEQIRRVLDDQRRAGFIKASPDEAEYLIVNAWIVATYWIDYLRSRHGVNEISREHVRWGAQQVMSLFIPYLTPAGQAMLPLKDEDFARTS